MEIPGVVTENTVPIKRRRNGYNAGVLEYWIVNPQKNTITVFDFEKEIQSNQYSWDDDIPVCIYGDFILNINKLLQQ